MIVYKTDFLHKIIKLTCLVDNRCSLHRNCNTIHNADKQNVQMWGPLWGWSCFPFRMQMQWYFRQLQGTGIVLKQIMKHRQVQACIRRKGLADKKSLTWKIKYHAMNCDVAGAMKKLKPNDLSEDILIKLREDVDVAEIKKIEHIAIYMAAIFSLPITAECRNVYVMLYFMMKTR